MEPEHNHKVALTVDSIPQGTSDVVGRSMRVQQYVLSVIQSIYERFGFSPHDTPIIENAAVFQGHHGEGEKLLFRFHDKDQNSLVLRYDLYGSIS